MPNGEILFLGKTIAFLDEKTKKYILADELISQIVEHNAMLETT